AERAFSLGRDTDDRGGQAESLHQMGLASAALGDTDTAIARFRQALALFHESGEPREEARVLYELARLARDGGRLTEARGHVETALGLVESLRARLMSPDLRASYFALVRKHYQLYIDLLIRSQGAEPRAGLDVIAFETSERARARSLLDLLGEAQTDIREGVDRELL